MASRTLEVEFSGVVRNDSSIDIVTRNDVQEQLWKPKEGISSIDVKVPTDAQEQPSAVVPPQWSLSTIVRAVRDDRRWWQVIGTLVVAAAVAFVSPLGAFPLLMTTLLLVSVRLATDDPLRERVRMPRGAAVLLTAGAGGLVAESIFAILLKLR